MSASRSSFSKPEFAARAEGRTSVRHRLRCHPPLLRNQPGENMRPEVLERRRLFSVTVTQDYPGYYEVNADDSGNTINIAVSQTDGTFTLDGTTYSDVTYIQVNGGAGNDTINVTSNDGPDGIGVAVGGGAGDDTITTNIDASIWAGDGNDQVHVSDSFEGQIYGEAGNDQIYVSGRCINAIIDGGSGDDLIDATQNSFAVQAGGGAGNDTILGSEYDDSLDGGAGSDYIAGNGGDDVITSRQGQGDTIDGGAGNDTLYANGNEVSAANIEWIYIG
jgi:Ca2+-binding RTX toxin-like protein